MLWCSKSFRWYGAFEAGHGVIEGSKGERDDDDGENENEEGREKGDQDASGMGWSEKVYREAELIKLIRQQHITIHGHGATKSLILPGCFQCFLYITS